MSPYGVTTNELVYASVPIGLQNEYYGKHGARFIEYIFLHFMNQIRRNLSYCRGIYIWNHRRENG